VAHVAAALARAETDDEAALQLRRLFGKRRDAGRSQAKRLLGG
jgi:hypothetical protein